MFDFSHEHYVRLAQAFARDRRRKQGSVRVLVDLMWQKYVLPFCHDMNQQQREKLADAIVQSFCLSYRPERHRSPVSYLTSLMRNGAVSIGEGWSREESDEDMLDDVDDMVVLAGSLFTTEGSYATAN